MDNLMDIDLYELIGTVSTATIKDIKTAYRKKALSCHPDKNPDNPKAAELFHQLSKALEILTDTSARGAYDKVLNAKHQAKLRSKQLDSKRKKLKEDLEAREEAYRRSQKYGEDSNKTDEQRLQAEIDRLRTMGSKQVEEEVAFVRQQVAEELRKMHVRVSGSQASDCNEHRVKIKWRATKDDPQNGGYDYNTLHRILSKYGDISILVVSASKTGRALVEYNRRDAAEMAIQIEQGLASNPITLEWVSKTDKNVVRDTSNISRPLPTSRTSLFPMNETSTSEQSVKFPSYSSAPNIFNVQSKMSDLEFESSVLSNLRRAQERKRLMEEISQEDP